MAFIWPLLVVLWVIIVDDQEACKMINANLVIPSFRFSAQSMAQAIIDYDCNYLFCVPTMLLDLTKHLQENNETLKSLQFLHLGGSVVSESVLIKTKQFMPTISVIQIAYGLSETSCLVSSPFFDDQIEKTTNSVGFPIDYSQVKIVDTKSGQITKLGVEGGHH